MKFLLILSCCLLSTRILVAQNDDGIQGELHRRHIGQITFMADSIPLEKYSEKDMLSEYRPAPNGNLYIRVFLAHSLMHFQRAMEPAASEEDLNREGNFQFRFMVDGRLIYRENVNPGSGGLRMKNKNTIFRAPLISAGNEDHWGRYMFRRFMAQGGEHSLTPGKHRLRVEIRPYLNIGGRIDHFNEGPLMASGDLTLEIPPYEHPADAEAIAVQPIAEGSGWERSKTGYDSATIRALNEKIAVGVFKDIKSIVVIRDGKLLLEEYFNGAGRDTLMDTRSCGKSFASAMMGVAIRDGYIQHEFMTLSSFYDLHAFEHYSVAKDSVRLRDLLTMSSAFGGSDDDGNSPGNEENMYPTPNWVKFTLDLAMDSSKRNGGRWDYFTAGAMLLGDVIDRSVPGGLDSFCDRQLMKPLGIETYQWVYTPQHVPSTAGGIRLRALDLARFGQLYKNGGTWKGQRILPADWVKRTFTKYQLLPNWNAWPGREADEGYGYLFWNKHYTVGGVRHETFYCSGNGGNKVFVFKDKPLVIVVTATAYGRPYAHPQVDIMMTQYILPAVLR